MHGQPHVGKEHNIGQRKYGNNSRQVRHGLLPSVQWQREPVCYSEASSCCSCLTEGRCFNRSIQASTFFRRAGISTPRLGRISKRGAKARSAREKAQAIYSLPSR